MTDETIMHTHESTKTAARKDVASAAANSSRSRQRSDSDVDRYRRFQVGNSAVQRLLSGGLDAVEGGPARNDAMYRTILPPSLRRGLESLSGLDLSGVSVYRDAPDPASLGAAAYTRGRDIYLGPGQEDTLPHEGWHVVQQLQGRVEPTIQRAGLSVNDDASLEREADTMGARAARTTAPSRTTPEAPDGSERFAVDAPAGGVVQRTPLEVVGAESEGLSIRGPGGEWRAPGEVGYSQRLLGASGELAEQIVTGGDLSSLILESVTVDLQASFREQERWSRRETIAGERADEFGLPPSIEEMFKKSKRVARQQQNAIVRTREELLGKVANYNGFAARANTFFQSTQRLSSMQYLLGAGDSQQLAQSLQEGIASAREMAAEYREAYPEGSQDAAAQLALPSQDDTVENALQTVNQASRDLQVAYQGFRVNAMQDLIRQLTEAGQEDRDRLDVINQHKQFIGNIGATLDLAMPYVSPSTPMLDAAKTQLQGAMPTPGAVVTLIGDAAFAREESRIRERLTTLDNMIEMEREMIDRQLYDMRKAAFLNALETLGEAREQLNDRMRQRREDYWRLGRQLDRFARTARGGRQVRHGREHYTLILTVVAQVREVLTLGRWAAESRPSPDHLRSWSSEVLNDRNSERWRINGFTYGEAVAIRQMYAGLRAFPTAFEQVEELFGPVDRAAGTFLASLRPEGSGEY